ncbi:Developmental regulatory protein wetA [Madurella fahalii]|uniref:Developmental regulatory protein wetA n=1 Tax=Madurella fahalii TaxID=1157608 RepID=A0ABQ0GBU0_9PEZI
MDAGGLAQMSHAPFNSAHGMAMPSGLASRRGGQNIKPLSFDAIKSPTNQDNGLPTPRTSRSHLLAGLRTAPKSATASSFPNAPASPTTVAPQARNRNSMAPGMYDSANLYNGPKTSMPRFASQQQPQQQGYNPMMGYGQQYTADQVLAPPQLQLDETIKEHIDPNLHAQLMYTNAYLSEQQQRLQQQLRALQAAAQQFQGLSLNGQAQMMQQGYPTMYQQQLHNVQAMMAPATSQPSVYSVFDPVTGQQTLYMDQSQAQLNAQLLNQAQLANAYANMQQSTAATPRFQVSPAPSDANKTSFRIPSPPRRYDSPSESPTPLPPPSANAFRRGHKKSGSTVNINSSSSNTNNKGQLSIATEEPLKSAGLKTASVPPTPMTAGYGPGQGRAGEHPVRQPRNPPSLDELKSKPTSKHEGSKNFVARTRRSAINNLVRAGLERRKEARSSGSISPISESTEELIETPMTDNDSDSGRSGSGVLIDRDDAECSLPSSRTSTGSWGAIGSDRPNSRQKRERGSIDSVPSDSEGSREPGSFASLLKNSNRGINSEAVQGQRRAPRLVLTSAEKRKLAA